MQRKLIIVHAHYWDVCQKSRSTFRHFLGLIRDERHEEQKVRDLKGELRNVLVPKDSRELGQIEYRPYVESISPELRAVPS